MFRNEENAYNCTGLTPKFIFIAYIVESNEAEEKKSEIDEVLQLWLPMLCGNKTASVIPGMCCPCAMKYFYNGS